MSTAELFLIRHAPALDGGRLAGRRDVPADVSGLRPVGWPVGRVITSPALRCRQTAAALFPGVSAEAEDRLWEQDFGAWEGRPYADLPDLGALSAAELAEARPHGGESFADVVRRVSPVWSELSGNVAVVAHAGTVRAALACALGSPGAALAFQIAPPSLTRCVITSRGWSVASVNVPL